MGDGTGGVSSNARAPWDESCSPVPATISRAVRGAANESLHGFADGSSGCQGARSFPALFICLCSEAAQSFADPGP